GIGLDINLYIDASGNIRKEDWDEPADIVDKIYYLRYGKFGDPLYVRAGALDNITLGYGLIMESYSNAMEYPQIRRVGAHFQIKRGPFGFEGLIANIREIDNPGLLAGRVTYSPFRFLKAGINYVIDGNQYAGLKDRDGDYIPDLLDDFPDNERYAVDSDGDDVPDQIDPDIDGDGYTDNSQRPDAIDNDPDGIYPRKADPFSIRDKREVAQAFGVDVGVPIMNWRFIDVLTYAQWAKIAKYGMGLTFPGLRIQVGPVKFNTEYRYFTKEFLAGYFNQVYDIQRVRLIEDPLNPKTLIPQTKSEYMLEPIRESMSGIFAGADINVMDIVSVYGAFQDMKSGDVVDRSLYATATLNPVFIPKITTATAFYQQTNVEDVFDFNVKTESTILGYKIGYAVAPRVTLLVTYRETYKDKNGDGKIEGSEETIITAGVETIFSF
ncbi:MAG: hypothetical protein ACE5QV_01700, partial [Fidelibacterota bacterium]